MLDDIEREDIIKIGRVNGQRWVVQVVCEERIELDVLRQWGDVDSGDVAAAPSQFEGEIPPRRSEVQHTTSRGDVRDGQCVGALMVELGRIALGRRLGSAIEATVVQEIEVLDAGFERCTEDVTCIFHPVYVAKLVAVVGRYG